MKRLTILIMLAGLLAGCTGPNTLALYGCTIERPAAQQPSSIVRQNNTALSRRSESSSSRAASRVSNSKANPDLNFNKNGLVMTPNNVCTEAGAQVEINITPVGSSDPGTIVVVAKNPVNSIWLLGTNSDDPDKISITIPEKVPDGRYDYLVVDTATGRCLDPRWEVE